MNNPKGMNKYRPPNQRPKEFVRPNSASGNSKRMKASLTSQQKSFDYEGNNYNNNINNNNEPKISMFDEYYRNKKANLDNNIINNNNIYLNDNKIIQQENQIINNNIQNNNNYNEVYEVNNNNNRMIKRPLTAKNRDIKQKDFLADNKHIISCIQNANNNKINKKNSIENPYHREYGKTPKYLQNMKIEAEKKKEIEKLKKETSKYPKGTRLLSEEERLFTLEKLKQSKIDINQIIEKLPITCDSQAFRSKREELFKKLDEIENAIETFSKKKVFVKIENN